MDYELIEVLKDIRDELKTQNERLDKIEEAINRSYGGTLWKLLENLQWMELLKNIYLDIC